MKVLMIGPYPPPVHGQSLATQNLANTLKQAGIELERHDVSGAIGRKLWAHLTAVLRIAVGRGPCYISLNSNVGMWLSAGLVLVSRIFSRPLILHHHSYAHVRRRTLSMVLLARVAGRRATHLVLSTKMAEDLKSSTPEVAQTAVLNNAGLVAPAAAGPSRPTRALRIGFIGNLTVEKGIETAVHVVSRLHVAGLDDCQLIVAGGSPDAEIKRILDDASHLMGDRFDYRGPVYGDEKDRFFADIDLLLFPSKYRNEASPLVLMEAMAAGVPCITTDIGCIREDIGTRGGLVIGDDYASNAPMAVQNLASVLPDASLRAREQFGFLLALHLDQLSDFVRFVRAM